MKKTYLLIKSTAQAIKATIVITYVCAAGCTLHAESNYTAHVNTLTGAGSSTTPNSLRFSEGTENRIQNIPVVGMPNAMTGWMPQTQNTERKCVAPYYYTDSLFHGFRGTHWLNGSCVADYGSFTLMPVDGRLGFGAGERATKFSHANEIATPFLYSVFLYETGIHASVTGGERCAMFHFVYSADSAAYIALEVNNDRSQGFIEIDRERRQIRGYNPVNRQYRMQHLPAGISGYFVVEFDCDFEDVGIFAKDTVMPGQTEGSNLASMGAYVRLKPSQNGIVMARAGTSFTGLEGAERNLRGTLKHSAGKRATLGSVNWAGLR